MKSFHLVLRFWLILPFAAGMLFAAPGDLDTSFGAGVVRRTLGGDDQARGVVVLSDGRLLVAGFTDLSTGNYDFILSRFTSTGQVDSSFGSSGTVRTAVGSGNDRARDIFLSSGDKVVLGGESFNGTNLDFSLVRHLADGTLDSTFGTAGKVVTPVSTRDDYLSRIIELNGGKILAVGYSYTSGGSPENGDDIILVRWNANGTLDTSFNSTGKRVLDIFSKPEYGRAVHVLSDGKMLVAGEVLTGSNRDIFLARLTADGQLDTTFNGTGYVTTTQQGAPELVLDMKVQADDKIVLAGWGNTGSGNDFALVRYHANGSLDTDFNGTGLVTTSLSRTASEGDQIYSLAIQPDHKLIVAGTSGNGASFAVARYMPNGTLDGTFNFNGLYSQDGSAYPTINANGRSVTPLGTAAVAHDVVVHSDGSIIVVGQTNNGVNNDLAIARYLPNGTLDPAFGGSTGKVTTPINTGGEEIYSVALAAEGKIVVAGHGQNGATRDFTVARYLRNGFLDVTFGTNGKVQTPIGSGDDDAEAVAIDSMGRIVVAGHAVMPGNGWDFAVVRYNTDGTLDTSFGSGGKVTTKIGDGTADDYARSIAIAPDWKILVTGEALNKEKSNVKFQVVRYNSNGTIDTSFGTDSQRPGVATASFGSGYELPRKIILEPGASPKIIVAGYKSGNGGHDIALARFNYTGALDTSFELDGMVSADIGARDDVIQSVVRQSDGRIVMGGHAGSGGIYSYLQVGFTSAGNLDNTFDTDGVVLIPGGSGGAFGYAMALQPNDRIVMAGTSISGSEDFGLFRVQANGALDSGFGSSGKVVTPIGSGNERALACVIQPDGRIIAAGHTWNGSNNDFALVRYLGNVPVITTGTASPVAKTTAQFNGTVTHNGIPTTVRFEHGLTTAYGSSTPAQAIGVAPPTAPAVASVNAAIGGLLPNTLYHYRLVAYNGVDYLYGADSTFTTSSDPPVAYTLTAADIRPVSATLLGIVAPGIYPAQVRFEYGTTLNYGAETAVEEFSSGTDFRVLTKPITFSEPVGTTYHYRIIASHAGGMTVGADSTFVTQESSTPAVEPPVVTTDGAMNITTTTADLTRTVNPQFGTTHAWFQYGLTTAYAEVPTPQINVGNSGTSLQSQQPLTGLLPGTLYHYRAVAKNGAGTTVGADMTFTTRFLPPVASTGTAVPFGTTGATFTGTVMANGMDSQVTFQLSADGGLSWTRSESANPSTATGYAPVSVTATMDGLSQIPVYRYRCRSQNQQGDISYGEVRTFQLDLLLGLTNVFPAAPPESEGFLTVNLTPSGILHGWRFVGEQQWRPSGVPVAGLTTSNREIEFRPVPGYIQPPPEPVSIVSGEAVPPFNYEYISSGATGSGGLVITLKPDNLTTGTGRAQWRLLGENDTQWRDSDVPLNGLIPGSYLVECKPVTGRATPPSVNVTVVNGQTAAATITYFLPDAATGTPPAVLSFESITTDTSKPYAHVGQIRSTVGNSTGFVVKPRVVATAAHVVWDDGTLASLPRVEWLFQRYRGTHEPEALIPRGHYTFDGYAAQRITDNSPGDSSPQSQHLDVAAIYFNQDAGRGGYSGFLASDLSNNEFLLSNANKMLVGYPMDGISATSQGRMHATAPFNVVFSHSYNHPVDGVRTFSTSNIRSSGGNSGGPLCVQFEGGAYYPAAIYLGGDNQTVARAIDSAVIELFNRAQTSSGGGDNQTDSGITGTSFSGVSSNSTGNVQVFIEPAEARAVVDTMGNPLARWRLGDSGSFRVSGAVRSNLPPSLPPPAIPYELNLTTIAGFQAPAAQTITVTAGQQTTITYTYAPLMNPQESWRQTYFGTTSNTGNAADTFDFDGDGFTNAQEYAAGTNPTLSGDFFNVTDSQRTASTFTASTAGKAGRTYTLQRSTNLTSWTPVGSPQGPLASNGAVTLQDSAMPNDAAFYRIVVTGP